MKNKTPFKVIITAFVILLASCVSTDYVENDYEKNVALLKNAAPYTTDTTQILQKEYLVDQTRAEQIREYFKTNTSLDLDTIAASQKSTWEKALDVAVFVAKNIPHNNQKEMLVERNAITLWEYSRRNKNGFNCRWHATILSELLLSIGIRNSFVTCLPYDKEDGDCHVVNIVWLPELNKWAMLDCDFTEYVTSSDGTPLSLQEMREYIQAGKDFTVNILPGFENSWVAKPSGKKYLQAYWAKNLYWFTLYSVYAFDLEGTLNPDGTRTYSNLYTYLVPPDYDCTYLYKGDYRTSNAQAFWAY